MIRQIAGWLAQRGRGWAWKYLHQVQRGNGQLPSPELFTEQLIQLAAGQGYLLCVEDLHLIEADPQSTQVLERLARGAYAGKLALILTSRTAIPGISATIPVLGGLSLADTAALFARMELGISPALLATLHAATEGNPEFLVLAAALLREAVDPGTVITRLMASEAVEAYLLTEIDKGLGDDERRAMEAVGALLGYGGSRHAIEALAEGLSLRRALVGLVRHNLLTVERRGDALIYHQHAIVQRFYADLPSQQARKALHRRAGAYYETEEPAPLLAARHYRLAGDHSQAAALISRDHWRLIQQGHAQAITSLLADLPLAGLSQPLRADLHTAQAEAAALLGSYAEARAAITLAIGAGDAGEALGAVRQARRFRLLAQIMEQTSDYDQAEQACRQGLALATAASGPRTETARLYMQLATTLLRRSALEEAAAACHAGLAALPPEPAAPAERSALLQRLATIVGQRDSYLPALEIFEQSLDLARQAGDPLLMAAVLHNMGLAAATLGQFERAETAYRESLRLKEELGDIAGMILTGGALGQVALARGDQPAARHAFEECYTLSERHQLRGRSAEALTHLIQLDFEQRDFAQARARLMLAEQIYHDLIQPEVQIFFRSMLGDIELGEGAFLLALAHGQEALALARQANQRPLEAYALRVIGEALLGQERYHDADQALAEAWAIGEQGGDPYDQALILAAMARLAMATGDRQAAGAHAQASLARAITQNIPHVRQQMEQLIAAIGHVSARPKAD